MRLENRTQIKNHKKKHDVRLIRPQAQHISPEYTYWKFWTASTTIRGENDSSSGVQVSCCKFTNVQQTEKYKRIIYSVQIIKAWQHISSEVTVECCISNALDETDDDMLWNGRDTHC